MVRKEEGGYVGKECLRMTCGMRQVDCVWNDRVREI